MSFRWFADVAPTQDSVVIKIQKTRKEPANVVTVNLDENLDSLKNLLKEAYETIR